MAPLCHGHGSGELRSKFQDRENIAPADQGSDMGTKLICFSLYASERRAVQVYEAGAIENQKTYRAFYPDFQTRFYVSKSLRAVGQRLKDLGADVVYERDVPGQGGAMWRFRPLVDGDFNIVLFRDADSRFSMREKKLVDAFLVSDKSYHIIKDYAGHDNAILAGMFAAKKTDIYLQRIVRAKLDRLGQEANWYEHEESFLQDEIYPHIEPEVLLHDSRITPELFSYEHEGFHIGMPFDEHGSEIPIEDRYRQAQVQKELLAEANEQARSRTELLEKKVKTLEACYAEANAQRAQLLQSTSWRATAPLRAVTPAFRKYQACIFTLMTSIASKARKLVPRSTTGISNSASRRYTS
jgi:hypothetical protein